MKEEYQLEKWIWNQNDFEQMGWHDNPIWAMSLDDDVKFDLDYLLKWVKPPNNIGGYKFWISPATLVFKNPTNFKVEMETDFVNGLEIADIERKIENGKTQFVIEAQEGRILIETEEFTQIIRRPPTLQTSQMLNDIERGPISFSIIPEKDYIPSELEIRGRILSHKLDEHGNLKTTAQIELDEFEFEELEPKERILKKREYQKIIEELENKINDIEKEVGKIYGW